MQDACPKTQGYWPYRPRYTFAVSLSIGFVSQMCYDLNFLQADLRPEYEVPPVNTSRATGSAALVLRDNSLTYTISYSGIGYGNLNCIGGMHLLIRLMY